MTPEQARKISLAAATISAYCRGDNEGLDVLVFNELGEEEKAFHKGVELADGLTLLAVETAFTLSQVRKTSVDQLLDEIPERDEGFVAGARSHWDEVLAAVKDIIHRRMPTPSESLPDALTSAFNLAFALQSDAAARTGKSTAEFASTVAREFSLRGRAESVPVGHRALMTSPCPLNRPCR